MKNIYQKILDIMNDIQYLQKDDTVDEGKGKGYKAITEEKVTSAVRAAMLKHGVVIYPTDQTHIREDEILTDKYGNQKVSRLTTVNVKYRIQNIEDKEDYVEAVSSGTGVDTQDKGVGKAMTYAYKYLLLRTFAIPTGEDADKISSDIYDEQFDRTASELNDKITSVQINTIVDLMAEQGRDLDGMLEYYKINDIKDMTKAQYGDCLNMLKRAKEKNG